MCSNAPRLFRSLSRHYTARLLDGFFFLRIRVKSGRGKKIGQLRPLRLVIIELQARTCEIESGQSRFRPRVAAAPIPIAPIHFRAHVRAPVPPSAISNPPVWFKFRRFPFVCYFARSELNVPAGRLRRPALVLLVIFFSYAPGFSLTSATPGETERREKRWHGTFFEKWQRVLGYLLSESLF